MIVGVNERPVNGFDDLYSILDELSPGEEARVVFLRDGKRRQVTVRLQEVE